MGGLFRLAVGIYPVALLAPVRAETGAPAADVPVRRVVLYSSGVGYFEHAGSVEGDATAELRFKSAQINDMLKSLVLQDLDGGRAGVVVYPSQDPLSKTLRSFQVDISGNPALGELLDQLRGAAVKVGLAAEEIEGMILGLETKTKSSPDGQTLEVEWWMNVLTGGTIRAVELSEVRMLELEDAQLREELNKALQAVAGARDQDKKPVTMNFHGQGKRRVQLGYVVETPIWKTSYRLIMPAGTTDQGKLLGWAIVENQTDSDWNGVTLSLVSGRPISFVQDLYQPLYIPRPVVQPELYASLTPQTYGAGIEQEERAVNAFGGDATMRRAGRGVAKAKAMPAPMSAPAALRESVEGDTMLSYSGGRPAVALDAAASVASLASAAEMGELFQYTVPEVTLPRQRSAMIPIVTDDVQVERVSIYNPQVLAKNPLNGALVKNTTGKHLLQGPITVLDDGYAGDARIEDLPPDQQRLLSYAVDLDVHVQIDGGSDTNVIETGKLIKGVLQLQRKLVRKQKYVIDNKSDRDKSIIIEHAFRPGWKLVDTPEPYEKTDVLYRFRDGVAAGKKSELTVTEERVNYERIAILPADIGQVQMYASTGEIPRAVRDALAKAIELKSDLVDTQRQIGDRENRIRAITSEQERIRANIQTIDKKDPLYARLVTKLNDQETEIEKLQKELDDLRNQLDERRAALENYLANLDVG